MDRWYFAKFHLYSVAQYSHSGKHLEDGSSMYLTDHYDCFNDCISGGDLYGSYQIYSSSEKNKGFFFRNDT